MQTFLPFLPSRIPLPVPSQHLPRIPRPPPDNLPHINRNPIWPQNIFFRTRLPCAAAPEPFNARSSLELASAEHVRHTSEANSPTPLRLPGFLTAPPSPPRAHAPSKNLSRAVPTSYPFRPACHSHYEPQQLARLRRPGVETFSIPSFCCLICSRPSLRAPVLF